MADKDVKKDLTKVEIKGPKGNKTCDVAWKEKFADCRFTPVDSGSYVVKLYQMTLLQITSVWFRFIKTD
jgi:hypothetical protein